MPRNLTLWDYADMTHPFYTTMEGAAVVGEPLRDTYPDSLAGTRKPDMQASPISTPSQTKFREPLQLAIETMPSAGIWQKDSSGNTVMSIRRRSRFMKMVEYANLDGIRQTAQKMFDWLQGMSVGPYTMKLLRKMGHPYGLGKVVPSRYKGKTLGNVSRYRTARLTGKPQPNLPTQSKVPDMTVINVQSGKLLRSWRFSVTLDATGLSVNFWNTAKSERGAPYPWFLVHGTTKMQPHGPWAHVAKQFEQELNMAWLAVTNVAWRKSSAMAGVMGQERAMRMAGIPNGG